MACRAGAAAAVDMPRDRTLLVFAAFCRVLRVSRTLWHATPRLASTDHKRPKATDAL